MSAEQQQLTSLGASPSFDGLVEVVEVALTTTMSEAEQQPTTLGASPSIDDSSMLPFDESSILPATTSSPAPPTPSALVVEEKKSEGAEEKTTTTMSNDNNNNIERTDDNSNNNNNKIADADAASAGTSNNNNNNNNANVTLTLSPTTVANKKIALESATSNYVYIPSKDYAWIPARLLERHDDGTAVLSVPIYANENSIQSDGGRHAKYLQKVTLDLSASSSSSSTEFNAPSRTSSSKQLLPTPLSPTSAPTAPPLSSSSSSQYHHKNLLLQNVNDEGRLVPVQDMVDLPFLHEAAILYNLKDRHLQSKPYTRTGDIVIACNPYQWINDLYSRDTQRIYAEALVWKKNIPSSSSHRRIPSIKPSTSEDSGGGGTVASVKSTTLDPILDPRRSLEPHIYETAALAYRGLAVEGMDQSILVSGESGAGKTESVKICLHHIAAVQQGSLPPPPQQQQQRRSIVGNIKTMTTTKTTTKTITPTSPIAVSNIAANTTGDAILDSHSSPIVQRVLDSNPLLEAFGNAKTVRNDNSSRFGKYIQLQFDAEDPVAASFAGKVLPTCVLAGSVSEVYLLEKSRVVHHSDNERTYHIFYQLLAADEDVKMKFWSGLQDTDQESFWYVGYSDTDTIEGQTDQERFQSTLDSLALIGIVNDRLTTLIRAICIVLQLGNIILEPDPNDKEKSTITSTEELEALADVMGITTASGEMDLDSLTAALTIRTVTARNEIFKVPLRAATAKDSVDAFAKEIYAKTFLWLVRAINDATCAERNYDGNKKSGFGTIGLLDIFGFESFEINRFEQLCINYANEKLQQKFTQDIFRSVQMEYENEGIELDEIKYDDNTDVLDLVEGRMGLLAFLNEECVRPGGSDKGFVAKAAAMNKDSSVFFRDSFFHDVDFGVKHYAGEVVYNATGFVTKNMDTLPIDLEECAMKSSNEILSKNFLNESMMNSNKEAAAVAAEIAAASGTGTSTSPVKPKKKPRKRPTPRGGNSSAGPEPSLTLDPTVAAQALKRKSSNLIGSTVWTKFKGQLTSLMTNLSTTRTRYIRCIKPNSQKAPLLMEHLSTIQQLRCAGVVAAVTISRSAFPNRLDHDIVLDRFKSLWDKGAHLLALDMAAKIQADELEKKEIRAQRGEVIPMDSFHRSKGPHGMMSFEDPLFKSRFVADKLLTPALQSLEENLGDGHVVKAYVLGKTRTYFRAGALEHLEAQRLRHLGIWAIEIQRIGRAMIARRNYHKFRLATIELQALVRRRIAWTIYLELRRVSIAAQCWYRCILAGRLLVELRRNHCATLMQTHWRMAVAATLLKENIKAAIIVQTMVRGSLQRPKFRAALHQKKEDAKLENQIVALQRKLEEAENRRLEAERLAEERARKAIEEYEEKKSEAAGAEPASEAAKSVAEASAAAETEATAPSGNAGHPGAEGSIEQMSIQQQQTLMDESGKMLEYLRKEVFKLRSQNAQMRTDFDLLKDNNQRLMDANASAGASFAALNQHAKYLTKTNEKLAGEVVSCKQQIQKLSVTQVELKEELKMKQATYVAEIHSRLQYQKALSKVVDIVQEQCRDSRLVESVLEMADECEAEYMGGATGQPSSTSDNRGNNPAEGSSRPAPSSNTGLMSSFRSFFS